MAARALGAGQRLAFVLGGEHTERHWDASGELHLLDAPGALPRDQVVVRGLAPDNGADAHHGIDLAGLGQDLGAERDLEGARYRDPHHSVIRHAGPRQSPADAADQPLDDRRVPARPHDPHPQPGAVEPVGDDGAGVLTRHGGVGT